MHVSTFTLMILIVSILIGCQSPIPTKTETSFGETNGLSIPKTNPSVMNTKIQQKGTPLELDQFKNIKPLPTKEISLPTCQSRGGVQYKHGTMGYDSCIKEQDVYTPTGFESK